MRPRLHTLRGKVCRKVDFSHTKAFRVIPGRTEKDAQKKLDFLIERQVSEMFSELTVNQILNDKGQVNIESRGTVSLRETELKPTKVVRWKTYFTKKSFEKRASRWITHLEGMTRKREVTFEPYPHIVWR